MADEEMYCPLCKRKIVPKDENTSAVSVIAVIIMFGFGLKVAGILGIVLALIAVVILFWKPRLYCPICKHKFTGMKYALKGYSK
ncbi:MAG: hypothetical protein PHO02_06485 [Candidatus Nanoarchaeia archaeon]|nr:hypothetical protein [Candidatus Nanoarchaeia archaeon]